MEKAQREDVHGGALAVRHATLAPKELSHDTGDGAAVENGERLAAVCGDDTVVGDDSMLEAG